MTRAVAAVDSARSSISTAFATRSKGGIIQSMSWTLYESVDFDETRDQKRGLVDLSDFAVQRGAGHRRRARRTATGPAVPRHRRSVAGADGGRYWQCSGISHRPPLRDLPLTRDKIRAVFGAYQRA